MKRFSTILAALALVVSMQGCDNGPLPEPELPDNPDNPTQSAVQMHLKGNISAITPATRVNADGFEANDKVGVYVSATGSLAKSENMLNNEAFTYAGGNITAPEGKEVYWGTPNVRLSVWAYYPYVESISNNAAYPFAVATDQSLAADFYDSDFITAQATDLAPQAEAVNLTFNHSLSKIAVTLTKGTGITDEEWAAATKRLSVRGVVVNGTIDLADGTATIGTTKGEVKSYADGGVYSSIVYPQESEITFRLEMGDDIYTYTTDADYEAGYEYDYSFTINASNPQQMTLNTTTITPWGDGGETEMGAMSDIISIADPVFKAYLLNAVVYEEIESDSDSYTHREGDISIDLYYTGTYYRPTTQKIDANNDGEISIAEAEKVVVIDVRNLDIASLSGLEHFTNLTGLYCSRLWGINGLYKDVTLPTLDISKNTKLKALWCEWCALTTLDVSNNTELIVLKCGYNEFTSVDLSNNLKLIVFNHQYRYSSSGDNKTKELASIDVTKNTALTSIDISSDMLTSIDVSKNINLTDLSIAGDNLTSIDVSKNRALTFLSIGGEKLTSIDISHNTELDYLSIMACGITSLDIKANTKLTSLTCQRTPISSIDLSNNTNLKSLTFSGNKSVTTLDLSNNTELEILWCYNNALSSLDISNCTKLNTLTCYTNNLASLDLSNNPALENLSCSQNRLTTLDVTHNTLLNHLNCEQNLITSLDLSKNSNLQYLICSPMDDADGYNLLETIYIAEGQSIGSLKKPYATNMVVKE